MEKLKGLTSSEVERLTKEGKINKTKRVVYKSHLRIIYESFFSFFNIILYVVALIFLFLQIFYPNGLTGIPLTKYGFLIIILFNGVTSLISEERSKHIIEKMEIINDENVKVIRDGEIKNINSKEIVEGDLLIVGKNETINVDGIIVSGEGYFNESIITGESNNVFHRLNEKIISGSFLVSSKNDKVVIKVTNVGDNTYIKKLEHDVKKIKKDKSKLNKDINRIILIMILVMIPSFLIVLLKELIIYNFKFNLDIVNASSTIIVGMIPIGLVLLSSVTLANSIYKLAKEKVLTQELYAIERLARIDVLALDKTGTITTQNLIYKGKEIFNSYNELKFKELLSLYLSNMDDNLTSLALKKEFNLMNFNNIKYKTIVKIHDFDSSIKYSSLNINDDNYKLGAFDILINKKVINYEQILEVAKEHAKNGERVLAFIKNDKEVVGLLFIENELRKNITNIISYFEKMNINIKVISGDNLFTVSSIAKKANIKGYNNIISLENVPFEKIKDIALKYDCFARATPKQKEEIIRVLEENGHKVGYVGDGINDITSLRRASCSIALASGVKSSKLIADFTLLDDDFIHLVRVIEEGRRVVNNIKRSCTLFISKDIVIALFAFYSIFSTSGMLIEIESIYVFEFIMVALCGFLLSIEKNYPESIDSSIIKESLLKGIENGFILSLGGVYLLIINAFYPLENLEILVSFLISLTGPFILFNSIKKLTKYSRNVLILGSILTIGCLLIEPNIFLDIGYLSNADTLNEQLKLILDGFFDMTIFQNITIYEYIIALTYIIVIPGFFILLSRIINRKFIK